MKKIDYQDYAKHLKAMNKIVPCCTSKFVESKTDGYYTNRRILQWNGKSIRAGIVIGGIINNEPRLTDAGILCLNQWMLEYKPKTLMFLEFNQGETGNVEKMRARIIQHLIKIEKCSDSTVLLLVAKNPTMYDKIYALVGGNAGIEGHCPYDVAKIQPIYEKLHKG